MKRSSFATKSVTHMRVEARTIHAKRLAAYQRSCEYLPVQLGTNKPSVRLPGT